MPHRQGRIGAQRGAGACAALMMAACGGGAPPPRIPSSPSPEVSSASQASAATSGGAASSGVDRELTGDARASYDRGFRAWLAGDLPTAKDAFADAAGKAPKAAGPRYSLGCVLERLGDTQGALGAYQAAYAANPKDESAMGAYATLLARTGRSVDAEQFLNDRRAQGDSQGPTIYLAEVKSIEGDSPGCQLLAQQALAKAPDAKEAMIVIARDYYRAHKWDLALYALQAILDGAADNSIPPRDKDNPEALLLRGLIERESGQRKQAISDFERASLGRPELAEAHLNLGEMKLEAGNGEEALAPLEAATRYWPNSALAHLDLGDCYRVLGRAAESKRELASALSLDSTLAGAHYDLGLLYLFAPTVPGLSGEDDQLAKAIQELEAFKSTRGAKSAKGSGDDVDELLTTAKRKQSELALKKQATSPAGAAGTAPDPSQVPGASAPGAADAGASATPAGPAGGPSGGNK